MVARATHVGIYASDILAANYVRRVDDHLFTQAVLGWTSPAGGELPVPKGMRPRHAVAKDATGRTHTVVVPANTSDIWQRVSNTYDILGDDGALVNCTVTGLVGESLTIPS